MSRYAAGQLDNGDPLTATKAAVVNTHADRTASAR